MTAESAQQAGEPSDPFAFEPPGDLVPVCPVNAVGHCYNPARCISADVCVIHGNAQFDIQRAPSAIPVPAASGATTQDDDLVAQLLLDAEDIQMLGISAYMAGERVSKADAREIRQFARTACARTTDDLREAAAALTCQITTPATVPAAGEDVVWHWRQGGIDAETAITSLAATAATLREENERLARDVERYRWLCKNAVGYGMHMGAVLYTPELVIPQSMASSAIDAAIDAALADAAIAAHQQEGKG